MVTYCLGNLALRLAKLPLDKWRAELDALPEECPNNCGHSCQQVGKGYARVQYRAATLREHAAMCAKGRKAR